MLIDLSKYANPLFMYPSKMQRGRCGKVEEKYFIQKKRTTGFTESYFEFGVNFRPFQMGVYWGHHQSGEEGW